MTRSHRSWHPSIRSASRNRLSRSSSQNRKPALRCRHGLERLEDRRLLSSDPALALTLAPNPVFENAGPGAVTGTITRSNLDTSQPLTVNLTNSNPAYATVASSVTIAAGSASANFSVSPVDDHIDDANHVVNIAAYAASPVAPGLDSTFGSGGYSSVPTLWGHSSADFPAVKVQPDGKIVAGAGAELNGTTTNSFGWAISRTLPDGSPDTSFGVNGIVHTTFPEDVYNTSDGVNAITIQPDGKIVAVGIVANGWGLARYNTDGTPDTTFGSGGVVQIIFPGYTGWANSVAVLPNGDILVGGSEIGFTVGRFTSTGQLDTSFGTGGYAHVKFDPNGEYGDAEAMAVQPDGKIVITGTGTGTALPVARLNADGTADTSFNGTGLALVPLADFGSSYNSVGGMGLALQTDGKIVVAGTATNNSSDGDWVTSRLNANGTLDGSFNGSGVGVLNFAGYQGRANDVTIQPDGKIVLAGYADVGGSPQFYGQGYNLALARYNPDGSLDASFHDAALNSPGKYVFNGLPSVFEEIWGVDMGPDGKLDAIVGYYDKMEVARFDLGLLAAADPLTVTNTDGAVPVASNDAYSVDENASLSVAAPGVLGNDTSANGTPLLATIVAGPSHGVLTLNTDGSFSYTPASDFHGVDSFTYEDGEGNLTSNIATVTITVHQVPVAVDDSYSTYENQPLTITNSGADSLAMVSQPGDWVGGGQTYNFTTATGTFGIFNQSANDNEILFEYHDYSQNGEWWYLEFAAPNGGPLLPGTYDNAGRAAFRPASQPGLDVFGDGRGSNVLSGSFVVKQAVYDASGKVLAFDATFVQHSEDATPALTGEWIYSDPSAVQGVLGNDLPANGTALSAALVSGPSHGSVTLNADGTFAYQPAADYYGPDSFTYQDIEGSSTSNTATVNVTVKQDLTPTVAVADAGGVYTGTAYPVTAASVTGQGGAVLASLGDPSLSYSYYQGTLTAAQVATATPLSGAPVDAGNYTVVAHYTSNVPGYSNADSAPTPFSITPAAITYTIANDTQTYGSPANLTKDLTATINGVNGETLDITYSSAGDTAAADVGSYAITGALSDGSGLLSNYAVTLNNGTLTVSPYAFTYTIGNDSQIYGSPASLAKDLGTTINGVNGETLDITYSSAGDTAAADVGSYAITGAVFDGSGLLSNYTVTLNNGTLTVDPYAFTYTIGNDSQTYGSPADLAKDLGTTIDTGVNGQTLDITYASTGDTATANAGSYPITGTVSAGSGALSDYTVTLKNGTLTVDPYAFTYTIGNDLQVEGFPANLAADLPAPISGVNGETLNIAYASTGDTVSAAPGAYPITGALSNGTGTLANYSVTLNPGTLTVAGPGATAIGDVLYLIGGNTNDHVDVNPVGASVTGSSGVHVVASLNGVRSDQVYSQSFKNIYVVGFDGNDHIDFAPSVTIPTLVREGDGNDQVWLGNGNNTVTVGNGSDQIRVGNGNNVIVAGNGNDDIQAGNGDNLIVGGLGHSNVNAGNGNNILIDGSVSQSADQLWAVLDEWMAGDTQDVQADLAAHVTYNTTHANRLNAGSGRDWFWASYAKDHLNVKPGDLLN